MVTIVEDAMPNLSVGERVVKAKSWTRMLEDIIPVLDLQDALDYAFKNHASTFPINHYDLKNAYTEIKEKKAKEKAKSAKKISETEAVANCKSKHLHIILDGETDAGEIYHWNWVNPAEDWIVPCFDCRKKAYKDWRARMVEKHKPPPEPLKELANVLEFKKKPIIEEVRLSAGEIAELLAEHNSLVRQITDNAEARRNLELIFDEGANIFKLPHRADLTYSAAIVQMKIKDYRRILEKRKVAQI